MDTRSDSEKVAVGLKIRECEIELERVEEKIVSIDNEVVLLNNLKTEMVKERAVFEALLMTLKHKLARK